MMERRNLHIRLSPEAYDALRSYADEAGVTVTALIEAAGRLIAERGNRAPTRDLMALARRIDREHRSRRH